MTREYVIKIEMPDGDDMSSAYLQDILQDIIQTDFDVEDKGRWKVSVKEKQGVDKDTTNEEKAKDITKCLWFPQKLTEEYVQRMLCEMAEWKDKQLEKLVADTFALRKKYENALFHLRLTEEAIEQLRLI